MALPNPIYIDEQALHRPSVIRLLAYSSVVGQQGVLGNDHLKVNKLGTAGPGIQVMPGGYSVLARHLGGEYEAYVGKFSTAETVTVSPTSSSAARSDLVMLIIENPYVSGSGSWSTPASPVEGPYAYIRVIEGGAVTNTTYSVTQINNTWSAIPLARIDRPANTGVVEQAHIKDLRSLAVLGGTRTVIVENPAVEPPPIASTFYMQVRESLGNPAYNPSVPATDNVHDYWLATSDSTWRNWPDKASWNVPVPSWAVEMDIDCQVFGAQNVVGDVYGEFSVSVDGTRLTRQVIAIDFVQQPARHVIPFAGTFTVPTSIRGRTVTFRTQMRSYYATSSSIPGIPGGARLDAKHGTTSRLMVNFQRKPD